MQPEIPQPMFTGGPEAPKKSRKKVIIMSAIAAVIIMAAAVAAFVFFMQKTSNTPDTSKGHQFKPVEFATAKDPFSYAGNKMYDACNIVPGIQDMLKQHVEQYTDLYQWLGTDNALEHPIKIDHGYIDRTIPGVLGDDGKARSPGTTITEQDASKSSRAHSFMSIADSYCHYGQGIASNFQYAKVHVIQPPTPLPPELLTYLDELKQQGRLAAESQGVQAYVETVEEGDSEYTIILKKGSTVAFLASKYNAIVTAASDPAVSMLAKEPTGPMTATYPAPYAQLKNPCELLSADEFERLLGKPAGAITTETLNLTEVDKHVAMRECTRYEAIRLRQGEITTARVALYEAKTEDHIKARLNTVKTRNSETRVSNVANLGDEAYLVSDDRESKIVVRVGKRLIEVRTDGETKDTNTDAFSARTLPVAKVVVENLKK